MFIKPCPVCGKIPKVEKTFDEAFIHVRIKCKRPFRKCHANVHAWGYFYPEERAIETWNKLNAYQTASVTSGGYVDIVAMRK